MTKTWEVKGDGSVRKKFLKLTAKMAWQNLKKRMFDTGKDRIKEKKG